MALHITHLYQFIFPVSRYIYYITLSMELSLSWEVQLLMEFSAIYGIRKFITVFIIASHWSQITTFNSKYVDSISKNVSHKYCRAY
jgi:hypothetical protein